MENKDLKDIDTLLDAREDDPDAIFAKLQEAVYSGNVPEDGSPRNTATDEKKSPAENVKPAETNTIAQEAPPTTTAEPSVSTVGKVVIDDSFIKQQKDPELQSILSEVKGEEMSPKMLKMFVNEQTYIRKVKRAEQARSLEANAPPLPKNTQPPLTTPTGVDQLVLANLKAKYPDAPTDPAAFDEYLKDLQFVDPKKFHRVMQDYDGTQTQVVQYLQQYENLKNNWVTEVEKTVDEDIQKFTDELSSMGLTPADLGLDLQLNQVAPNGAPKYNEYLFKNVIYNEDGRVNPDVVNFMIDVPMIRKGSVYETLMRKNLSAITQKLKGEAPARTAPRVATPAARPKPVPPPSMATARGGNFTPTPGRSVSREEIIDPLSTASVKDIDKELDALVAEALSGKFQ